MGSIYWSSKNLKPLGIQSQIALYNLIKLEKSIQLLTFIPMGFNQKVISWIGTIISSLVSLIFIMSASMKLTKNPEAVKGMDHLGIPAHLLSSLGILEASCLAIYLIPKTSTLGAILLTGYLGGAILTHLRIGEPIVLQIAIGVAVWAGLFLREPRLRHILPFRK